MFIQPDGKIVAAGYAIFPYRIISSYFVLSRYNIDGSLDNSFLGDGKQTTHLNELGVINSIALQSNGKIVAAGSSGINDNNDFTLARYNADGNPDTTFGKNGIQITQLSGANDEIKSIAISGDKLYAAGYVQSPGNVGIVARYLLDNEMKIPTVTLSISDSIIKYTAPARGLNLTLQ